MQTNMQQVVGTKDASIKKLQQCMRRELSAVETYDLALKSLTHVGMHHTLQEIFVSHSRRAERLGEQVRWMGGEPPTSSGVWGAFAKAIQAGADLLGNRVAIAALEEGEDLTLKLYTSDPEGCDAKTRNFIDDVLLPEQRRTHELCRTVEIYAKEPS